MQRSQQRGNQRKPQIAWRPMRSAEEGGTSKYDIPAHVVPDGMDWQWKRLSYAGKEDTDHQVSLQRDGAWDPVPHSAWPERLGVFGEKDQAIVVEGLVLMQRPLEYTEQVREEEKMRATSSVSDHFKSLGLNDSGAVPKMKAKVKMDYSSVQVAPADEDAE